MLLDLALNGDPDPKNRPQLSVQQRMDLQCFDPRQNETTAQAKGPSLEVASPEPVNPQAGGASGSVQSVPAATTPANTSQQTNSAQPAQPLIRIAAQTLDQMINDAGEVRLSRALFENNTQANRSSLTELRLTLDRLKGMINELSMQAETQMQSQSQKTQQMMALAQAKDQAVELPQFDPLEFDRFTRLQEISRLADETLADMEDTVAA